MKFSRKIIVTLLLLFYVFGSVVAPSVGMLSLPSVYAAESVTILTVTTDGVNVRTGPGTSYSRIAIVNEGDVFTVIGQGKDPSGTVWYNVNVSGKNGYIISNYAKITTQTIDNPTSASPTHSDNSGNIVIVTGNFVNIRAEASSGSRRIATASRGDTFTLLEKKTDSRGIMWYKVSVGNTAGYISSAYGTVKTTSTTVGKSVTYLTVTGGAVNIRSGAGTSYSRLGTLQKGDQYTVLGQTKDGSGVTWYKINVSGVNAYINGTYVVVTGNGTTGTQSQPTTTTTKSTTTIVPTTTTTKSPGSGSEVRTVKTGIVSISSGSLNVRSGAGKSYGTVGSLKKGAKVIIVGSSNGWYKIEYSGSSSGYGYVSSDYISNVTTETTLVTLAFGSDYYYVNVGSTVKVSASASGYTVSYSSSDTANAPVDSSSGTVTGKTPGMYTITAKSGSISATTEVVVLKPPYSGVQHMTISPEGVEFIAQWEGGGTYDSAYNEMTFVPYKDEVGYWTIGYGHAKVSAASKSWSYARAYSEFNTDIAALIGSEHIMTDSKPYLNQQEAYLLLNADLVNNGYVGAVSNWAVRNGVKLSQPQFDSLVSFCFNLGQAYWTSDTYLFYLKSAIICQRCGDDAKPAQIVEGFTRYMKAGGKNLKGLWWRRRNEAEMFTDGDYAIDRENKFTLPGNVVWG